MLFFCMWVWFFINGQIIKQIPVFNGRLVWTLDRVSQSYNGCITSFILKARHMKVETDIYGMFRPDTHWYNCLHAPWSLPCCPCRPGISSLRGKAIFILQRALPLENILSLRETFEGAPRPRPGQRRACPSWPHWNSRPALEMVAVGIYNFSKGWPLLKIKGLGALPLPKKKVYRPK